MRTLRAWLVIVAALLVVWACDDSTTKPREKTAPPDTLGAERVLLEAHQFQSNHNGGGLTFDNNGYLYLALGDGGGAGDNEDNAQDPTNLLGAILRLEVTESSPYYVIPVNNPFVDNGDGWREEIFAYGLRNPWRISVDPVTNHIWAGDVGQATWEEIDVIESGKNYGWDCREGAHTYTGPPGSPSVRCRGLGVPLVDPVFEYQHDAGNISITGGYVYRGTALPGLVGKYVYADYGSGRIWAFDPFGPTNVELVDAPFRVSSFGVDEDGELYFLEYAAPGAWTTRIKNLEENGNVYSIGDPFPDLEFTAPVDLHNAGDGSGRMFVVQQEGKIKAFDTANPDTAWTYQDLTARVTCCGEQGLLGLAFHPQFSSNGYIYVYYTANSGGGLVGRLSRIKAE
jgi:glucose/arabinose dehydrogenase